VLHVDSILVTTSHAIHPDYVVLELVLGNFGVLAVFAKHEVFDVVVEMIVQVLEGVPSREHCMLVFICPLGDCTQGASKELGYLEYANKGGRKQKWVVTRIQCYLEQTQ
jgi:hypothetical protein